MKQNIAKTRLMAVGVCLMSAAACLVYSRFRAGLPPWWRSFGGGIPYVVFWICFGFVWFPERRFIPRICWIATLGTCGLEFLQLWNPPWLAAFRGTRFGAALLGSTFVWEDFPPYLIGGVVGWLILHAIVRVCRS